MVHLLLLYECRDISQYSDPTDIVIFHNSWVASINIESREITVTGLPSND